MPEGAVLDQEGAETQETNTGVENDDSLLGAEESLYSEDDDVNDDDNEGEGSEDHEDSQDDDDTPSSLADLAQHLDVDAEALGNLTVPVKVNGTPAEASVQDLVNSYQTQEAATQILEDAKAKRTASHQEIAQEREAVQNEMGVAGGLILLAEQAFQQELSDADLAKLRETDQEKYLIEKDRLTERRQALDAAKQKIGAVMQQYSQQSSPTNPEVIAAESKALIEKMSDLEPQENRVRLAEYIMTQGFSREEISNTADHRLYVFAEKARLYDELQAKRAVTQKKVEKIPKHMKPGSKKPAPKKDRDAAEILYG